MKYLLLLIVVIFSGCGTYRDAVYNVPKQHLSEKTDPALKRKNFVPTPIKDKWGTVKVKNLKSKDLFSRAKFFFADGFTSYKGVVQLEDEYAKTIIGKGNMNIDQRYNAYVSFTLIVQTKDNYYRYLMKNFELHYKTAPLGEYYTLNLSKGEKGRSANVNWSSVYTNANTARDATISTLEYYMKGKARLSDFTWWQKLKD